jgi:hypothetical protein
MSSQLRGDNAGVCQLDSTPWRARDFRICPAVFLADLLKVWGEKEGGAIKLTALIKREGKFPNLSLNI